MKCELKFFLTQTYSFSFFKKQKWKWMFTYVNQRDDMLCHMERLQPWFLSVIFFYLYSQHVDEYNTTIIISYCIHLRTLHHYFFQYSEYRVFFNST